MSTRLPAALSFPLFTAIAIAATLLWNGPLTAVAQESSAATSDNESQDSSGESTDESSVADSTASNSEGEGEEESEATNEYATHLLGMTLSNNANGDANNEEGSAGATADDRPNETPGALVVDIDPLSPAWNAGVRTQDIVVSFSGFDAEDESFEVFINAAREVVKARKEGDTIAITIVRDGEEQDLRIEERSAEVTIDDPDEQQQDANANGGNTGSPPPGDAAAGGEGMPMAAGGAASGSQQPIGGGAGYGAYGRNGRTDIDYYFGSGGYYGGGLTSTQQTQLDRLEQLDRDGDPLNAEQREQLRRLVAIERGNFSNLGPLTDENLQRLQTLQQQAQGSDNLSNDQRAELRQLTAQRLAQDGDLETQRRELAERARSGDLDDLQRERLRQLQAIGPNPQERVSRESGENLSRLQSSDFSFGDTPQQQQRFQYLMNNRRQLNVEQRAELRRMQYARQRMMAGQLRGEYNRLMAQARAGGQLNAQQQQRLQQLQQNQRMFAAGAGMARPAAPSAARTPAVNRSPAVNPGGGAAATANQPQPIGAGSGIGTAQTPQPGGMSPAGGAPN